MHEQQGGGEERGRGDLAEDVGRCLDGRGHRPGLERERHGDRDERRPATAEAVPDEREHGEEPGVAEGGDGAAREDRVDTERDEPGDGQEHDGPGGDAHVERGEFAAREGAVAGVPESLHEVDGHGEVEGLVLPEPYGPDAVREHDDVRRGEEAHGEPEGDVDGEAASAGDAPAAAAAADVGPGGRRRHPAARGRRETRHSSAAASRANRRSRFGGSSGGRSTPHIVPVGLEPRRGRLATSR